MNIIINDTSYNLVKTEELDYIEYAVYKNTALIGHITKSGVEILYTARDTSYNIITTAATLRDTLEAMILNMFYSHTYKGDKHIKTLGAWIEGTEIQIEYVKKDFIKHAKRVVRYSKTAGDLYIVIDNNKYFYCEFD